MREFATGLEGFGGVYPGAGTGGIELGRDPAEDLGRGGGGGGGVSRLAGGADALAPPGLMDGAFGVPWLGIAYKLPHPRPRVRPVLRCAVIGPSLPP